MEGKWIQSSAVESLLTTLNLVARGELTPIQGINQYGSNMALFFSHIQYRYIQPKSTYASIQSPDAFKKVWQYQRQSTLCMFDECASANDLYTHTIRPEYLHLMLNLHKLTPTERLTSAVYSGPMEQRFLEIQQEIWDSPSLFSNRR